MFSQTVTPSPLWSAKASRELPPVALTLAASATTRLKQYMPALRGPGLLKKKSSSI
jgi:hypothetical protein